MPRWSSARRTLRAKSTASGDQTVNTDPLSIEATYEAIFYLDSDGGTGTLPTLAIEAQVSPDGGMTWYDVPNGAFTQDSTIASRQMLRLAAPIGSGLIRLQGVIGGTNPVFNFGLWAELKS